MLTLVTFAVAAIASSPSPVEDLTFEAWEKEHSRSIQSVAFASDFDRGSRTDRSFVVSSSNDGTAIVWDLSGSVRHRLVHAEDLPAADLILNKVRVSPDGTTIALAGSNRSISLWNSRNGARLGELEGHGGRVQDLGWSADGRRLASCDDNGSVRVWDSTDWSEVASFSSDEGDEVIASLAISPNGRQLAFGTRDDKLHLFDIDSGDRIGGVGNLNEEPQEMEFSPDGRLLAVAEGSVFTVRTGTNTVRSVDGHRGAVRALVWSRDSERIFTAGDSGEVFEWNASSGAQVAAGSVRQYVNDIALCYDRGAERLALAKPAGIIEIQQ